MMMSSDLMKLVLAIRREGGTAYLVGGCVRDRVMWRTPKDIDMEVYGLSLKKLRTVLEENGTVNEVGVSFGVFLLVLPDGSKVDVSVPRRDSKSGQGHRDFVAEFDPFLDPTAAAARRDFTMNSMLMDPLAQTITDPFGGRDDMAISTLRHTSPAFIEDPLRVLRGMQFASRFNMSMDPDTATLCATMIHEAYTLPVERVWGEWQKWAMGGFPSRGLDLLRKVGWVTLWKELEQLIGCPQDPVWHPEGDVWTHTLLSVDEAAHIAVQEKLPDEDRVVLVFAALLHDVGKPSTTTTNPLGRIISHGHAEQGALDAESFLSNIGMPIPMRDRVCALVAEHMWGIEGTITKRGVRRLAFRLGKAKETVSMLAHLMKADSRARAWVGREVPPHVQQLSSMAAEVNVTSGGPVPILMGRHLIDRGCAPGPMMGIVLKRAMEAQLDGLFTDLEGAMVWLEETDTF